MGGKVNKRRLTQLVQKNVDRRKVPHRSTTTRRDITASGTVTTEVPRQVPQSEKPKIKIVSLLDSPSEETVGNTVDEVSDDPNQKAHDPEELEADKTQTRQVLDGFLLLLPQIEDAMFTSYANPYENQTCGCGSGARVVQCWDCTGEFAPTCGYCFVSSHRRNTDHWAHVWDPVKRIFTKTDYTAVMPESEDVSLTLGHPDGDVSHSCFHSEPSIGFTIIHRNGVHSTRIRFCRCRSAGDRAVQLIRARLFPASANQPQTAFSFSVLKSFQMLNLQSKTTAFDYILALRRMTDNVRTHQVPDPYKAFTRITRVWDYITTRIHVGLASGINTHLPSRPDNSIITYCPACPEPEVNMPEKWVETPPELKHIVTLFRIMDGNHRAHRYTKNSDPNDTSHWDGNDVLGYFPDSKTYQQYLAGIPVAKEKSVCSFINAVNAQDRKKFRGNDETGIIALMCPHAFVDVTVDMFLGERFAYSDYTVAHALGMRSTEGIPVVLSYDSACSYSVNILDRFKTHLPEFQSTIAAMRFSIDSLHVHDHVDKCMYFFSSSYLENMGHFHGTAAEQYWSEHNGLSAQTSQMNPGHRHEVITAHHSYWNWKKLTRITRFLADALINAWKLYTGKRDYFRDLSRVHRDKIPEWFSMDRRPVFDNGEVRSVFRHSAGKALSFEAVYQRMVRMSARPTATPSTAQMVYFLAEGISIQTQQITIKQLVKLHETHPLVSTKQEIKRLRDELEIRMGKFRDLQAIHMDSVKSKVVSQPPCTIEDEVAFLPSCIPLVEHGDLSLMSLAAEEAKLRLALTHECILQLRLTVKAITILHRLRKRNVRGQKHNTRARSRIHSTEVIRDRLLAIYNASRNALLLLDKLDPNEQRLPPLSLSDLSRKSTVDTRQINDTHRSEGRIWTVDTSKIHADAGATRSTGGSPPVPVVSMDVEENTTAGARYGGASTLNASGTASDSNAFSSTGGRLWDAAIGYSDQELEEWEQEQDRVQWHRAWAEMLRWLEEFELKHVEFVRVIKSFHTLMSTWSEVAIKEESRPGHAAFARRQAHIYDQLHQDASDMFSRKAERRFLDPEGGIIQSILAFRKQELSWLLSMAGVENACEDDIDGDEEMRDAADVAH